MIFQRDIVSGSPDGVVKGWISPIPMSPAF